MRKIFVTALLFGPLLWLTWGWTALMPPAAAARLRVTDLTSGVTQADRSALGPFAVRALWGLESENGRFGSYSALVRGPSGSFVAISDRNTWLRFAMPTRAGFSDASTGRLISYRQSDGRYAGFDSESAVVDPVDGRLWIGVEGEAGVMRIDRPGGKPSYFGIPALRDFPRNGGAEAMARLNDGRWVMLCESCGSGRGGLHMGLLFAGRPGRSVYQPFGLVLPPGYDPADAAVLPDGRLLILARRFDLLRYRFTNRLVLADLGKIAQGRPLATTVLARIEGKAIRENYEGLAVLPQADGKLAVWLISDSNDSVLQQTRLLHLEIDPAKLPGR